MGATKAYWSYLGGDLMLVEVGEVLEFGEDVFRGRKGLRLALFPFLPFLASCTCEWGKWS